MRRFDVVLAGLFAATLAGCSGPVGLMPMPYGGVAALGRAGNKATTVQSFAVPAAVVGFTADALLKVAADVRRDYGSNAHAVAHLRVTLNQVVQDKSKTVRSLDVTAEWGKLLENPRPSKDTAMKLLETASVSFPYPVNHMKGFMSAVPTGEAAGSTLVYYLKVESYGPIASRGQRAPLGEQYVSDFGKNFRATVE